jgi:uracil-DNA glycosylase
VKLLLCGEAWGENEARIGRPFVGPTGVELMRMMHDANLIHFGDEDYQNLRSYYRTGNPIYPEEIWQRHGVQRTNVFNFRPANNKIDEVCGDKAEAIAGYPSLGKSKYVRAEFTGELERLGDEILGLDPNLIVCLGNTALWAMAGSTGIGKLRGTTRLSTHTVRDYKLLPTYHPSAVVHQYELRPTTVADLIKAKREAAFPEIRRPQREIWIEPNVDEIRTFIDRHVRNCRYLSVDIETSGTSITCIGLSPRPDLALVVPFVDRRKKGNNYFPDLATEVAAWDCVKRVLEDKTIKKVFQNGMYDIAFLWRSVGVGVRGAEHDTMLLHHALQPESLKALGYLGSIYTDEGAWKTERKTTTIKRDE